MLYSLEDKEDLEKLNELVALDSQIKTVRLQDKLGKQNFHEHMEKVFEPVTKSLKDASEEVTKAMIENSIKSKQALPNLNNKLVKIVNDRGILATNLMSPLSKVTNPENTTQFRLIKDSSSNGGSDLLIMNTIPINLHENLLIFRDIGKVFEIK